MSKPPIFIIAIVVVIAVVASFRYLQQRRQNIENDAAPLSVKKVVVATKREKPSNDRRSRQREVTPPEDSIRYEIWFALQSGGMEMKMRVEAAEYNAVTVGDKGTLSYKGTRFVSFVPEETHLP